MRLQELFETTEEDRDLITVSYAVYKKILPYINSGTELVHLGKVADIQQSAIPELNDVSIDIMGGDDYKARSVDTNAGETLDNLRDSMAFWDEPTNTVVLNSKYLDNDRMKTTITHELRHALDEIKSGGFPASPKNKNPDVFNKYFTPKKKAHRKDPANMYKAQPAEINARFSEVLHKIADLVPKRSKTVEPKLLKQQLIHDFNNLLVKYEIADLFPEKTQSKDYKRLVKRMYDFMEKEIQSLSKN